MSLKKALENLKYSRRLFDILSAGKHIDISQDSELWNALTGEHREGYLQLFEHLGQKLKIDPRGFSYFDIEDSDAKGTRPLALLYLLIFQKQADTGQDLTRFDQWVLESSFFQELREKNRDILRSENLEAEDRWKSLQKKAITLGFFASEGTAFLLLPATWRFLDLFLELAEEQRNSTEEIDEELVDDDFGAIEEDDL